MTSVHYCRNEMLDTRPLGVSVSLSVGLYVLVLQQKRLCKCPNL